MKELENNNTLFRGVQIDTDDSGIPEPLKSIHECDSCVLFVMFEIS